MTAELLAGALMVVFMMALLVIGYARLEQTHVAVMGMARDAARAASQTAASGSGQAAADRVLQADSEGMDVACQGGPRSSVSGTWAPGGTVTAEVTCTVSLSDLLPAFPGTVEVRESAVSPIETYLQGQESR